MAVLGKKLNTMVAHVYSTSGRGKRLLIVAFSGDKVEKEMATHSSILTCRIPWTEEPGRLQSMGSQELDMTGAIITHLAAAASPGNMVKGKFMGPTPNTLNHNLWELEPVMCLDKVSRQFLLNHSLRSTDLKTPHSWLLASA